VDRILGLQGLDSFLYDTADDTSTQSNVCSLQSTGGQGRSSCSIQCFEEAQLVW